MADTLTLAPARAMWPRIAAGSPVELVGRSTTIARVQELVRRAAATDLGALITADAGSSPELIARELHERGRRAGSPFIVIECGARENVAIDGVLFGSPAAVTVNDLEAVSADSRIAAAVGGTLFLHEVTELPAAIQARLARIARDGEVRIDGEPVATAFRMIASAPPSVDSDVAAHRFRADLYRRLTGVRIDLPSLRERSDDVPALASRLLDDICVAQGIAPKRFTETALALIAALTWPGNLAELHDTIARVVAATPDTVIQIEHLLPGLQLLRAQSTFMPAGSLRDARLRFERDYIASVLQHCGWRMAEAAQTLGIQRPNLYRKARQLGIPLARLSE